jgi:hypothetical protein
LAEKVPKQIAVIVAAIIALRIDPLLPINVASLFCRVTIDRDLFDTDLERVDHGLRHLYATSHGESAIFY